MWVLAKLGDSNVVKRLEKKKLIIGFEAVRKMKLLIPGLVDQEFVYPLTTSKRMLAFSK